MYPSSQATMGSSSGFPEAAQLCILALYSSDSSRTTTFLVLSACRINLRCCAVVPPSQPPP
eukprot:2616475-Rhodomonas_salina.1